MIIMIKNKIGGLKLKIINTISCTHFGRMIVNASWLGFSMPLIIIAGLFKTILLARLLGLAGLGMYGLIMSFTSILSLIFGFNSAEAAITYTNRAIENDNRREAAEIIRYCLFFDFFLSVITYLVLVLVSEFFPGWFHLKEVARTALLVYGLSLMGNATNSVARGLLHACDCFKYDFFFNISKSWVSLACVAAVYFAKGGILSILAVESALAAIFGIILILLMFSVLHSQNIYFKLAQNRWWQVSRELWRYQILGYLRATVMGSHRHMGMLLLGYLTSPTEVGAFHAAKKITDPLRNSTMIFSQSLYPRYGKLWFSRESRELKSLFKKSTFLFIGIAFGLLILLGPLMGMIIRTLYGNSFASSIISARILLVSASLLVITAPLTAFLPAIGRNAPHLMTASVMVITQIVFLFILAPKYGAAGAAWAFLLAILAGNLVLMPQTLLTLRKGLKEWWYHQTPRAKATEI